MTRPLDENKFYIGALLVMWQFEGLRQNLYSVRALLLSV